MSGIIEKLVSAKTMVGFLRNTASNDDELQIDMTKEDFLIE